MRFLGPDLSTGQPLHTMGAAGPRIAPAFACLAILLAFASVFGSGCSGSGQGRAPIQGEAGSWLVKSPWHGSNPAVVPLASQQGQYNFAGGGQGRTWESDASFEKPEALEVVWSYAISEHTFAYEKQTNIWSTCAVTLSHEGKTLVVAGAYDRKIHCLDGTDGTRLWRFTAGGEIVHAPSAAHIDGRPMIFFTAADRTVYALGADGSKIWSFEALPWSYTVTPSTGSSPVLFRLVPAAGETPGEILMAVTMGLVDAAPLSNIQSGEVIVLRCRDGSVVWRKRIGSTPPVSPTLSAGPDGKGYLIVPDTSGTVWCLDPATGATRWRWTADYFVHGPASIAPAPGIPEGVAAFGTRFGVVSFLRVTDGSMVWSYRAGHYVDATPTRMGFGYEPGSPAGPRPSGEGLDFQLECAAFFGSYDRSFYALGLPAPAPAIAVGSQENPAGAGQVPESVGRGPSSAARLVWRFPTENQILSAALAARTPLGPCLFVPSFDRTLYCLDARTGQRIWQFTHGELIFPYIRRGDANFSSPTAFVVRGPAHAENGKAEKKGTAGRPRLLYPAFDGRLYCFGEK